MRDSSNIPEFGLGSEGATDGRERLCGSDALRDASASR